MILKTLAGVMLVLCRVALAHAEVSRPISGADVSSLIDVEKAGGIFRDSGVPGDELVILRRHGCTLFRVRLFVNPDPVYNHTAGATQTLDTVRELGRRIKAAGGQFLLDLHYSDTWADPGYQHTPRAWQTLNLDALKRAVGDYTTATLRDLQTHGAAPEMVQVGNEITNGMLWPTGQVHAIPPEQQESHWTQFVQLLSAGVTAVRTCELPGVHTSVMLHVDGGGRDGRSALAFDHIMSHGGNALDFDVIGLSFYPAWGDDIGVLKKTMNTLEAAYHKDILLAEVAYPYAPLTGISARNCMRWPTTPAGQSNFVRDVRTALLGVPDHHGLGFVWWFSDAIPLKSRGVWRGGREALFDSSGDAVPALNDFGARN